MDLQIMDVQSYRFQTEEDCEKFLMELRWSNGFCCPRCDYHEAFTIRTRRLLECKDCRMQVSITAGTIMHKSKLSLLHWFRAIQLLIQEGKDYTASSLSQILQINYRSAQLLLKKIHFAHLFKENRLNLFQKARNSVSPDFKDHTNQETVEGTPQSNKIKTFPKEWDLCSYLESKINRLNSKLTIRSILPNDYQKYVYNKNRSRFVNVSSESFDNWIKTFISVQLYPTFLKCFQLPF
ncbi:Transposase zinc-ribbon domain-containing protein [Paenibacillus sp. yr247]|uniref:transposase n=1 Tax=Paenibacillus sp. yr247 TaxID=1761880 RepID=UPI00088D370F|nr:transposase [Paenibacillus sp. yr247]SDO10016.1 Transposase zinc-ribbon domain-containing protein [Paenibacillus sp. yr247]